LTASIVIDLDDTITINSSSELYPNKLPNIAVVEKLREYRRDGFKIVIFTARNQKTYDGNLGLRKLHTLPVILTWLKKHNVPFDEIRLEKPWCGDGGFYVDDKAIRPSEFLKLDYSAIKEIVNG
jgi:capsule biosynthesis phosphatase